MTAYQITVQKEKQWQKHKPQYRTQRTLSDFFIRRNGRGH